MNDRSKNILAISVKLLVGIIGLLVAAVFMVAAGYLLTYFKSEVQVHPIPLVLALVAVATWFALVLILDINKKVKATFARERVNLRWFIIMPLALAPGIIMMLVYMVPSSINYQDIINTNFNNGPTIEFAIYFVAYVLLQVSSLFLYFSIKNFRLSQHLHVVKFPVYSIANVGMFALMLYIVITLVIPNLNPLPQTVSENYTHNDGPWVTWNADPRTSACISWLTSSRSDTTLTLGTMPSNITMIKIGAGNAYLHKVYLTGLSANTTYYYKIPVTFEEDHASTTFSFHTAPDVTQNFTFAVFGDKQPSTSTTMLHYNKIIATGIASHAKADFVMQVGDLASNGGNIEDWHLTLESLALLSANTPTQIAIGNHDYGNDNGANFGEIFSYPYNDNSKGWYYSFNYSNAHFVVIDGSAIEGEFKTNQLAWVKADLYAASAVPSIHWIFAFVHQTVISDGSCNTDWQLQSELVPLFDHYNVKAVFYGHDHFYEHYIYTYGNHGLLYASTDTWAHHPIQYFVTGGGGANLETAAYGDLTRGSSTFSRIWFNQTRNASQNITYYMHSWNASKFYMNETDKAPDGKIYYQNPAKEVYQEDSLQYGYEYGENSYHYMLVQVGSATCTISAHYADGSLMKGPIGLKPQLFTIT